MHWTIAISTFASGARYQLFSCVGKMIHTRHKRYVLINILCFLVHFLHLYALYARLACQNKKNNKKNSNYIDSIVKFKYIEILYLLHRFSFILVGLSDNLPNQNVFIIFDLAYINVYIRIYKCNA